MSVGNSAFVYISTALALLLCALCAACGGGGRNQADLSGSVTPSTLQPESPDPAVPPGVDAGLWEELLAELERSCSFAPRIQLARVTDLELTWLADGQVQAAWEYNNPGDYDLNGVVNIADLVPVARYFEVSEGMDSWPAARVADGNGDGEVNIADVTVIGAGFGNTVDAYYVMAGEQSGSGQYVGMGLGDGEVMALIQFADAVVPPAGGLPLFSTSFPRHAEYDFYWASPVDLDAEGSGSDDVGIYGEREHFASDQRGDWYMQYRDARHSSVSALPGPQSNFIKWLVAVPGSGTSQPVYSSAGLIFIGGSEGLHAINPDGTRAWIYTTDQPVEGTPAVGPSGAVYFGCSDGGLYSVAQDGELVWRLEGEGPIITGIAVDEDGVIYSGFGNDTIAAIAPDGQHLWLAELGSALRETPAISSDGTILVFTEDRDIVALNPDGSRCWQDGFFEYYSQGKTNTSWTKRAPSIITMPNYLVGGKPFAGELMVISTNGIWMMPMLEEIPVYLTVGLRWVGVRLDDQIMHPTVNPEHQVLAPQLEDGLVCFDADMYPLWTYDYPRQERCELPVSVGSGGRIYVSLAPAPYVPSPPGSGNRTNICAVALQSDGSFLWQLGYPAYSLGQLVIGPDETAYAIGRNQNSYTYETTLFAIGGSENNKPPAIPPVLGSIGENHHEIQLMWGPAAGATGYALYRDTKDSPYQTFDGTVLEFDDTGLEGGEIHTYWLRGFNDFGFGEFTEPYTTATILESPSDFAASDGEYSDRIVLTWTRSPNATSYKIQRDLSQLTSEPYAIVGDVEEWVDTGVTDWNQHTYKIIAYNEVSHGYYEEDTGYLKRGTGDTGPGSWRQFGRDSRHTFQASATGPATDPEFSSALFDPFRIRFTMQTAVTMFGAEGCQYLVIPHSSLVALNPDGTLRWSYGVCGSAVTLDDGALAFANINSSGTDGLNIVNSDGTLRQSDDSHECWQLTLAPAGDLVVSESGSVSCYTPELSQVWTFDASEYGAPLRSEPAVVSAAGSVYFGTEVEQRVVALSAEGEIQWNFIVADEIRGLNIGADGSILVRTIGDHFYSLSPDGEENWSLPLHGNLGVRSDGLIVFVVQSGPLLVLDPTDGSTVWEYDPPQETRLTGPPVIDAVDNVFVAYDYEEELFSLAFVAGVLGVDAAGELLWHIELEDDDPSGLALDDSGTLWLSTGTDVGDERGTRRYWFR